MKMGVVNLSWNLQFPLEVLKDLQIDLWPIDYCVIALAYKNQSCL